MANDEKLYELDYRRIQKNETKNKAENEKLTFRSQATN